MAVSWLRQLATSLPPPGFNPGSAHVGFVEDKVALGQVFPWSVSFHQCSSTWKRTKNNHRVYPHHRVAQDALRLWCIHSICCRALHHLKKKLQRHAQNMQYCFSVATMILWMCLNVTLMHTCTLLVAKMINISLIFLWRKQCNTYMALVNHIFIIFDVQKTLFTGDSL
jgi:hypothetical protein